MPGILGIVQSDGIEASGSLDEAIRRLSHFDGYLSKRMPLGCAVLAQVWRDSRGVEADWSFDGAYEGGAAGGVAVLVNGHVLLDGDRPRRLYAADIMETYKKEGRVPAADYDGAFVVVVADLQRRRLFVYNDRLGVLPVVYKQADGMFCFAPEAKAVFALARAEARLSKAGVVSLLAVGYCIGETTAFDGVKLMEPGCVLSVDIDSAALRRERYWTFSFDPSNTILSRREAEDELYEAILRAHRLMLCDDPADYEVMLSGGLDSRAVPAFMQILDRPPARSFTWGVSDDIPLSDASLARRISGMYHIPFSFISCDSDSIARNAREWVWLSELANDNIGWFAEGAPVLAAGYNRDADFLIAGDVAWDTAGYAFNEEEAVAFILGSGRLTPRAIACMESRAAGEAEKIFAGEISAVMRRCESSDPNERKDHLYIYARMPRFLFSLGYYKELAVQVRRPFLTNVCMDLFGRLPDNLRNYKNVYVSMMKRRFPELMAIEENSADSLPDWNFDIRNKPRVRGLYETALRSESFRGGVLGNMLDLERFGEFSTEFFGLDVSPMSRKSHDTALFRLRRRVSGFVRHRRRLERMRRSVKKAVVINPRDDFDFISCATLISLLEEQLPAFDGRRLTAD